MQRTLSILIPAYNEQDTIARVLERILESPLPDGFQKEIVLVDDGSRDQTFHVVEAFRQAHPGFRIICLRHERNQGKGAALHTAIQAASGDYIIVQDADLEYDPMEYSRLLQPILEGHADVVYGSRFVGGRPHRLLFFWHSIGNRVLTTLCNMATNLNMTDMETCYKLFRSEVLKSLRLREKGFGFEPEVTIKAARWPQVRFYEVGISYYGRTYKEGKKIKAKDGFWAIICIIRYGFLRLP